MNKDDYMLSFEHFMKAEQYMRLYPTVLLTDKVVAFAKACECFWLLDVFASHLLNLDGEKDPFTVFKVAPSPDLITLTVDDNRGVILAEQVIEYANFPEDSIMLYGCWYEDYWIVMLPSEY